MTKITELDIEDFVDFLEKMTGARWFYSPALMSAETEGEYLQGYYLNKELNIDPTGLLAISCTLLPEGWSYVYEEVTDWDDKRFLGWRYLLVDAGYHKPELEGWLPVVEGK